MAIRQMTQAEYEAEFGIAPVSNSTETFDNTPTPRQMTQAEYNAEFRPEVQKEQGRTFAGPKFDNAVDAFNTINPLYQIPKFAISGGKKFGEALAETATADSLGDAAKSTIKAGAGFAEGALSIPIGVFEAATNLPGLKQVKNFAFGIEPGQISIPNLLGDKVSDIKPLQDLVTKYEDSPEIAGDLMMIMGSLVGVKASKNPKLRADVKAEYDLALNKATGVYEVASAPIRSKAQNTIETFKEGRNNKVVQDVVTEIGNVENNYAKLRKSNEYSTDAGASSRQRIAQTIDLSKAVDADGTIFTKNPGGPIDQYRKLTIDGQEGVVYDNLLRLGETVNLEQVRNALSIEVGRSSLEGADLLTALRGIEKEIKGLETKADEFGNIELANAHRAKINATNGINYQTPPEKATFRKSVARGYKTLVEDNSKFNVSEVNKELSKFYGDIKRLENLDGRKVKGGKLGKYFAQISGNIIGGGIGSAVGGSIGMAAGTIIGGEAAGLIKGRTMQGTFRENTKAGAVNNPILTEAQSRAGQPGQVNLRIADKKVGAKKDIPKTKEISLLEKDIENNVKAQKKAIKGNNFELVAKLKEIYKLLVDKLKAAIKRHKDTPNKQGGFVKVPKGNKAKGESTALTAKAKEIIAEGDQKPTIKLKRDVQVKTLSGEKVTIDANEVLKAYEDGGKMLLKDGREYIVSKNQYQNIKANSVVAEAKEFAPELKGLEEASRGAETWKGDDLIVNGDVVANIVKNEDGSYSYQSDLSEGSDSFKTRTEAKDMAEADTLGVNSGRDPKYSSYQLPDGKNYKEILIKAPAAKAVTGENARQAMQRINSGFKSSHWPDVDVISHLRLNERTYKGKEVTFMEELQSDWAREGRDKGFIDGKTEYTVREDANVWVVKSTDGKAYDVAKSKAKTGQEAIDHVIKNNPKSTFNVQGKIPFHPLVKGNKWQEPTIKRALQEAVNNNSEYFSWINGEQTSARYNLATQVKEVNWKKVGKTINSKVKNDILVGITPEKGQSYSRGDKGYFNLTVNKDGKVTEATGDGGSFVGKKLDEVLGKGLADKIMADEKGTLSGDGLKFGGEWAGNLYDRQVKNIVEKVTGGKVIEMDLGLPIDHNARNKGWLTINEKGKETVLKENELSVGQNVIEGLPASEGGIGGVGNSFIITEVLGDGKFKAVPKNRVTDNMERFKMTQEQAVEGIRGNPISRDVETFDISSKTTIQQGIKLTPEIISKIKGEIPKLLK